MSRLSPVALAAALALLGGAPAQDAERKIDPALRARPAAAPVRALVRLEPGASLPAAPGVAFGARAGDIVSARGTAAALAALAEIPDVAGIEAAHAIHRLTDLSGATTVGVSGAISAPAEVDTYTFAGAAGQTVRIRVHAESALDARFTVTDAAPLTVTSGGPGTDAETQITWTSTGPKTIAVTEEGATTGGYALFISSTTPLATADLAGGDGNNVFHAGLRAREARTIHNLDGAGVFVGIVDTGIDFAHADFRDAAGNTRVAAIWDQTLTAAAGETKAPAGYGVVYSQAQIDAHLDGTMPGFVRHQDTDGHGTHVAGSAAGDDAVFTGMAPGARLLIVKDDSTTAGVLDALRWLADRAGSAGLAICLSLGTHTGPHDGTSAFDKGVDAIPARGRYVIVAAGNEANDAIHARTVVPLSGTFSWTFTPVSPGGAAAIDIWAHGSDRYTVSASDGFTTVTAASGATATGPTAFPYLTVANRVDAPSNGATHISISDTMTNTLTLTFTRTAAAGNGIVDGYSDTGTFAPAETDFTGTISEPGTARQAVTVGAYRTRFAWDRPGGTERKTADAGPLKTGNLADFSSRGPTRDGRAKPDITAPGAWIGAAKVAGSAVTNDDAADGLHTYLQGTSMSAGMAAGALALLLQKNRVHDTAELKAALAASALADAFLSNKMDVEALVRSVPLQMDVVADPGACQASAAAASPGPWLLLLLLVPLLLRKLR
jgi:hypothetical protein